MSDAEECEETTCLACKALDSQRPGAWLGNAYTHFSAQDKAERTQVPVELLYDWWVNRRPSGDEFKGTFSKHDVRYCGSFQKGLSF